MHYTHEEEDRVRAEIDAAKAKRSSASASSETACQPRSLALATCSAFERWWHEEGSGMPPRPDEDAEAHVRRITEIAWSNGAYLEQLKTEKYAEELQQIAEALGMPFSSGQALVKRVRELSSPNPASEPRLKAVGSDGLFDGPAKDSRK